MKRTLSFLPLFGLVPALALGGCGRSQMALGGGEDVLWQGPDGGPNPGGSPHGAGGAGGGAGAGASGGGQTATGGAGGSIGVGSGGTAGGFGGIAGGAGGIAGGFGGIVGGAGGSGMGGTGALGGGTAGGTGGRGAGGGAMGGSGGTAGGAAGTPGGGFGGIAGGTGGRNVGGFGGIVGGSGGISAGGAGGAGGTMLGGRGGAGFGSGGTGGGAIGGGGGGFGSGGWGGSAGLGSGGWIGGGGGFGSGGWSGSGGFGSGGWDGGSGGFATGGFPGVGGQTVLPDAGFPDVGAFPYPGYGGSGGGYAFDGDAGCAYPNGWGQPVDAGSFFAGDFGFFSPYPYRYCISKPPVLTPEPLRDGLTRAFCSAASRCCKPGESAHPSLGPWPDEECRYQIGDGIDDFLGEVRASVAAGRSRLDEKAATACGQKFETSLCRDLTGPLSGAIAVNEITCPGLVVGLVVEGSGCDRSYECTAGLYCDGATCRKLPLLDQACPDDVCGEGLYCRSFPSGSRCARKEPDGRLCDDQIECASGSCNYDERYRRNLCGPALICTGR